MVLGLASDSGCEATEEGEDTLKRLTKELRDQPLHIAMTAAPLALAVFVPWTCWVAALWFMALREQAQHRDEGFWWWWPVEHRLQLSAMSSMKVGGSWRWLDLACGTLGGLVIDIVRYFV
jgi:hypothetical protein